jgi:hypothetical protein
MSFAFKGLNNQYNSVCSNVLYWCSILFVKSIGDKLLEQRTNIKYLVKLEKNAKNIHKLLQLVYEEATMGRTQNFVWVKWFQNGTEYVTHD